MWSCLRPGIPPSKYAVLILDSGLTRSHQIDQLLTLFGRPDSVTGLVRNSRTIGHPDVPDSFIAHREHHPPLQKLSTDPDGQSTTSRLECLAASSLSSRPPEVVSSPSYRRNFDSLLRVSRIFHSRGSSLIATFERNRGEFRQVWIGHTGGSAQDGRCVSGAQARLWCRARRDPRDALHA